jgi:hypothetical protein
MFALFCCFRFFYLIDLFLLRLRSICSNRHKFVCLVFGWLLGSLLVFAGWWPAGLVAGGFDPLILGRVSSRRWGKVMRDQIFVFRSCVEVFGWLAGVGCVFLSPVTFLARRR